MEDWIENLIQNRMNIDLGTKMEYVQGKYFYTFNFIFT